MTRKFTAMDYYVRGRESNNSALVSRALRMHDACELCKGAGGESCYYPEVDCPRCGFNVFTSAICEDTPRDWKEE